MKMKKTLAILSAITMSATVCLSSVSAMAETVETTATTAETTTTSETTTVQAETKAAGETTAPSDAPVEVEATADDDELPIESEETEAIAETVEETTAELPSEDATEPATEIVTAPAVNYEQVYSDFVYKTLIPQKGRAALNVKFTNKNYDVNKLYGVMSTAIYDFGQDGKKELIVVTREEDTESGEHDGAPLNSNFFFLNLYEVDSTGKVQLSDRCKLPERHEGAFPTSERSDDIKIVISGNAIYADVDNPMPYIIGETMLNHSYGVYSVKNGKFNEYGLVLTCSNVYNATGLDYDRVEFFPDDALLYSNEEIFDDFTDDKGDPPFIPGEYATFDELNAEIQAELKNAQVDFNSAEVKTIEQPEYGWTVLQFDIDVNSAIDLVNYHYSAVDLNTSEQKVTAAMIPDLTEQPTETTEPTTEEALDYDSIYYDFVYNQLIPEVGRAARSVAVLDADYDMDKLFGVYCAAIYDFDGDGVKELVVVTRDELFDDDGNSTRVLYSDTGDWSVDTTFTISVYRADAAANVNLLTSTGTETHTITSLVDNPSFEQVQLMISNNCIYEEYVTHPAGSTGSEALRHEYILYEFVDDELNSYKFTTDGCSVWEGNYGDDLLYYDSDLKSSYNTEYNVERIYTDTETLNNNLTAFLADNYSLDFTSAEVVTDSESVADFIDAPQYLRLNIDVVPDVTLMNYQFSLSEDSVYTSGGSSMLGTPLQTNEEDDDVISSVTYSLPRNSSSSSNSSSTNNNSSNNNSSDAQSPDTSDKLPVGIGLTALAALAVGVSSKKKKS